MRRAFFLYRLWLRSGLRRLRHDLGRELTVLVASVVLFATFFYIFNDFLNVQIAALSPAMRERFAAVASTVVLATAVVCSVVWVRRARTARRGLATAAAYLGETRAACLAFEVAQAVSILLAVHAGAWYAIQRWLSHWQGSFAVPVGSGLLLLCVLLLAWRWRVAPGAAGTVALPERSPHPTTPPRTALPIVSVLTTWRLRATLGRSRICSLCLLLALATQAFIALAAWRQTPPFVAAAAGLASGYFGALALCALLADDLRHIWLERGAGVSHAEFIQSYKRLGWLLAVGLGAIAALLYLATGLAVGASVATLLPAAAKLAATTTVPALVAPYLLFQIDARRLAITAVTVLIAALFIGTAVLASWLGLALIPILAAFAGQAQAGRFYRA